ncbi:hypothetical protein E6A45_02350 [Brachyspira pilosicoli]|uniref:hypothetical protein n=1 Tax=Brachyspira pilosicoli TaxID=52584 RepID=UPI001CA4A74D|nr:hypothetical protein [Brachyspira pilosicoli]MBW5377480.1 hypothetical protein [Brachyspira pilosicoli]WIH82143.1 hypothetical protein NEI04_03970 [Brachyspira pilosicoli]
MKKTIILITIFIIFLISCKANTTAPENEYLTTANDYKSSFPILGKTYLWVITTTDKISLKFGADTAPAETGEIIYDAGTGITNTMLSTDKNNTNTYAFQTGTLTGSLEVLDNTRIKVYFTQNVTPYAKIMEAVCEKIN